MKLVYLSLGAALVAVALAAFFLAPRDGTVVEAAALPGKPLPTARGKAVVLELFTSEGCSSCPSADALLSELAKTQPVPGVRLIPLAQHVDYWNNLGWDDRFSSRANTDRQYGYVRSFGLDSAYTPQLVVDGKSQFVGSDRDAALAAIAQAASQPQADVRIAAEAGADAQASVTVNAGQLPSDARGEESDVLLAVTESGLTTQVGAGENGGRTLHHDGVVRDLEIIGTVQGGQSLSKTVTLDLKPGWRRGHLQAVVFVQGKTSRRIYGAGEADL